MTPINVYPSTLDIAKARGDLTLALLKAARKRYRKHGTADTYIDTGSGAACAVGSVYASAGVADTAWDAAHADPTVDGNDAVADELLEGDLRDACKEAFRLLDKAATKLYPAESERWGDRYWSGPLEALNQNHAAMAWEERHAAVLRCYDRAVRARKKAIA